MSTPDRMSRLIHSRMDPSSRNMATLASNVEHVVASLRSAVPEMTVTDVHSTLISLAACHALEAGLSPDQVRDLTQGACDAWAEACSGITGAQGSGKA